MKRIVTLQDISCVGKCSLTVAVPILSALGVEACPIPTAVLSAHTAFEHFSFLDLTDQIPAISAELKKEQITFDAIYTGYLGSLRQVRLVRDFMREFSQNSLVVVDPVMGDNGVLYAGFEKDFPKAMASLCAEADVLVPNLTEAALLLGEQAPLSVFNKSEAEKIAKRLARLGPDTIVLTGICEGMLMGAAAYCQKTGEFFSYCRPKIEQSFHGTGDIFASVLAGMLTRGSDLKKALETAVDFTYASMQKTLEDSQKRWYGVNFEEALFLLTEQKIF